jgi:hypothetical protein
MPVIEHPTQAIALLKAIQEALAEGTQVSERDLHHIQEALTKIIVYQPQDLALAANKLLQKHFTTELQGNREYSLISSYNEFSAPFLASEFGWRDLYNKVNLEADFPKTYGYKHALNLFGMMHYIPHPVGVTKLQTKLGLVTVDIVPQVAWALSYTDKNGNLIDYSQQWGESQGSKARIKQKPLFTEV